MKNKQAFTWIELLYPAPISRIKTLRDDEARGGFTLIELLVVVPIIGILAAVALPQYQKAVEKSKAAQAITMLKSLGQAQTAYFLANGTPAEKFEDLDIDIPFTGNTTSFSSSNYTDVRSDKNWSFQLNPSYKLVTAGRLSGKYQGQGFFFYTQGQTLGGKLRCVETSGEAGAYCVKIFGAKLAYQNQGLREYDM